MTGRSTLLVGAALVLIAGALAALSVDSNVAAVVIMVATGTAATVAASYSRPEDLSDAEAVRPTPAGGDAGPLHQHPEFAAFIDGLSDPVLLLIDNRVRTANSAARQLLGQFIVDADVRTAIRHPAAVDRLARDAGGAVDDAPIDLIGLGTPDQRWQMRSVPMPDGSRLVLLADQTARDAVERMRADFVANASHELRTPLAAILGYVETLLEPDAGGDAAVRQRFLTIIDSEARRMQQLVLDLLSISRVEATKHVLPTEQVDVSGLMASVVKELRAAGVARAADISLDAPVGLPHVRGDTAQLSQVLHNLIGNALKYGRPGTPVRVQAERATDAMLRITVSDQGDGIAPEHLPRLTERFYRVDSARSRAVGGTGLGLAIVRHIVERHRGQLDIASELGVGTTVTVRLPISAG